MIKKVVVVLIFIFCWRLSAQQVPQYTQFQYNMSIVNPAYVSDKPGVFQIGSLYRSQWIGLDGAPKTANVFLNLPLNERIEIGVNYLNDNIGGVLTQNNFTADFSYKIDINSKTRLSFGLKSGIQNINLDFSNKDLSQDVAFQNQQKSIFALGAGVFLYSDAYYLGFSSPNLIPSSITVLDQNTPLYTEQPHFFLAGGYIFDVLPQIRLKPSLVAKIVGGAPLTLDAAVNVLYANKVEIGASYRLEQTVAFVAGFYVNPDLRIGYGFDYNTGLLQDFATNGSHELIITYALDVLGFSKKYASPRFY